MDVTASRPVASITLIGRPRRQCSESGKAQDARGNSLRGAGNCKVECGALAGLGLDPDRSAMPLDDFLADGQADARARIDLAGMQPLEDLEYPVKILRLDANPIIAHGEYPAPILLLSADMDARRRLAVKLEGVANEVRSEEHT